MAQYQTRCAHSLKIPLLLNNIEEMIPIAVFPSLLSAKNIPQNGVGAAGKNLCKKLESPLLTGCL